MEVWEAGKVQVQRVVLLELGLEGCSANDWRKRGAEMDIPVEVDNSASGQQQGSLMLD